MAKGELGWRIGQVRCRRGSHCKCDRLESVAEVSFEIFFEDCCTMLVLQGKMDTFEQGIGMWENFALLSPAFGMIGTLIGLVKMLGNMDDPTAIGPSMAVALLTTLYGSLIANVVALPLTKKLKFRSDQEIQEKEIIAQGLLSILVRETPRFLVDRLNTQLAPSDRLEQIS